MFFAASRHAAPCGCASHAANSDWTLIRFPPTASLSSCQLAWLGHAGSEGRTRRMVKSPATDRAGKLRGKSDSSGIAAASRKKRLLSTRSPVQVIAKERIELVARGRVDEPVESALLRNQ